MGFVQELSVEFQVYLPSTTINYPIHKERPGIQYTLWALITPALI